MERITRTADVAPVAPSAKKPASNPMRSKFAALMIAASAALPNAGCGENYPWGIDKDSASADTGYAPEGEGECYDGIDNDGDGTIDDFDGACDNNPSSAVLESDDETANNATQGDCGDGVDNDGDGYVDAQDAGCFCWDANREEYILTTDRSETDPEGEDCENN